MGASVWAPGSQTINVDAENTFLGQAVVVSAGQTLLTLSAFTYVVNTGSICVFRGGQKLIKDVDYEETDSTHVTLLFNDALEGEVFEVVGIIGAAGAASVVATAAAVSAEAAKEAAELAAASVDFTLDSVSEFSNKTMLATEGNRIEAVSGPNGSQLAGLRNKLINGGFAVNQRSYSSGAAVGAGLYAHDRWKMAASGDTYTFSTTANITTVTIPAGKVLRQVIEGLNLHSGIYTLSWTGTAQGKIGAGSYGDSGVTGTIVGGVATTIEFGPGTVSNIQLEEGSIATPFEQRPFGLEDLLCKRYYQKTSFSFIGYALAGAGYGQYTPHKISMRANPTVVVTGASISNVTDANINATAEYFWNGGYATAAGNCVYQGTAAFSAEL